LTHCSFACFNLSDKGTDNAICHLWIVPKDAMSTVGKAFKPHQIPRQSIRNLLRCFGGVITSAGPPDKTKAGHSILRRSVRKFMWWNSPPGAL
jgi:hypothetical protein